mgnify:CR=1 FL=1
MTPYLLVTDSDGEEYEHECTSYEVAPDGTIQLYIDGVLTGALDPEDWQGEDAPVFYDPDDDEFYDIDVDHSQPYLAYLVKVH